jgi:two-component system LytT family response regulator
VVASRSQITVIIADDEPLARELLRSMLAAFGDIHILAECGDGAETVEAVRRHHPDLLFLDIQMPELDGFQVLAEIPSERMPATIFVTAYDQYAIRAFEVRALDYMLKPFDEDRLERALENARQRMTRPLPPNEAAAEMLELLKQLQARPRYLERLVVREEGRSILQPVGEIDWLESDGKHIKVHVGSRTHTIRDVLTRLESELDPDRFMRISRSAIVNIERIAEIRSWFQGDYLLVLKDGRQIPTTRAYRDGVLVLLGKK